MDLLNILWMCDSAQNRRQKPWSTHMLQTGRIVYLQGSLRKFVIVTCMMIEIQVSRKDVLLRRTNIKKFLEIEINQTHICFHYRVASKLGFHFPGLIPIQTWGQFHKLFCALCLSFAPLLNFYAIKNFSKIGRRVRTVELGLQICI